MLFSENWQTTLYTITWKQNNKIIKILNINNKSDEITNYKLQIIIIIITYQKCIK